MKKLLFFLLIAIVAVSCNQTEKNKGVKGVVADVEYLKARINELENTPNDTILYSPDPEHSGELQPSIGLNIPQRVRSVTVFVDFAKDFRYGSRNEYGTVGSFVVYLNEIEPNNPSYGVVVPAVAGEHSPINYRCTYILAFNSATRHLELKQERMGFDDVGTWNNRMNNTKYGIRMIVGHY
ncbi:hypothetical protein EZS27_003898 [termite gut metagenome]|uniref:Lipoprotein n=1 Tax=termite gut metagenome TaxID=433724 RepID=A0A5J4SU21_9ZZZZ